MSASHPYFGPVYDAHVSNTVLCKCNGRRGVVYIAVCITLLGIGVYRLLYHHILVV